MALFWTKNINADTQRVIEIKNNLVKIFYYINKISYFCQRIKNVMFNLKHLIS